MCGNRSDFGHVHYLLTGEWANSILLLWWWLSAHKCVKVLNSGLNKEATICSALSARVGLKTGTELMIYYMRIHLSEYVGVRLVFLITINKDLTLHATKWPSYSGYTFQWIATLVLLFDQFQIFARYDTVRCVKTGSKSKYPFNFIVKIISFSHVAFWKMLLRLSMYATYRILNLNTCLQVSFHGSDLQLL